MKIKIYFHHIKFNGVENIVAVTDPSSVFNITINSKSMWAEAYHLEDWAKEHGFEYKFVVKEFDIGKNLIKNS